MKKRLLALALAAAFVAGCGKKKIEELEDDGVRIERPTPKYPDTRRTSAPAILWSAASFVSDQVLLP